VKYYPDNVSAQNNDTTSNKILLTPIISNNRKLINKLIQMMEDEDSLTVQTKEKLKLSGQPVLATNIQTKDFPRVMYEL
jgi:hypothetical protein